MTISLREAIEQLVNLGEKDPYEILDKLVHRNGEEWARGAVDWRRAISDEARYVLSLGRRSAEARASAHDDVADQVREVQLQSVWIEGRGYIREADLTVEDCRVRAEHHRKLSAWNEQKADQYERFAAAMEAARVGRLGDLLSAGLLVAA